MVGVKVEMGDGQRRVAGAIYRTGFLS
jgi:hypothetical protein